MCYCARNGARWRADRTWVPWQYLCNWHVNWNRVGNNCTRVPDERERERERREKGKRQHYLSRSIRVYFGDTNVFNFKFDRSNSTIAHVCVRVSHGRLYAPRRMFVRSLVEAAEFMIPQGQIPSYWFNSHNTPASRRLIVRPIMSYVDRDDPVSHNFYKKFHVN